MRLHASLCCLSSSTLCEGCLANISSADLLDTSSHLTASFRSHRKTILLYQTHEPDSSFCKTPIPIICSIVDIAPMCGFETRYKATDVFKVIIQLVLHEL